MRVVPSLLSIGAAAMMAACAHRAPPRDADVAPAPAGHADQAVAAATYPVPPVQPRGAAYVLSYGAIPLQTERGPAPFLHLRIALANEGDDTPWTVDPREQALVHQDGTRAAPTYAQASEGGPVLTVHRQARGAMDLYFAVGAQPGAVALAWQIRRGDDLVAETTPFQVVGRNEEHVAYRPTTHVHVGIGPAWWWWGWWPHHPFWYPYWWYRPSVYWGIHGYWGPRYRGGGVRTVPAPPARGWRGGGAPAPSAPRGGGGRGWRR